MLIIDEYISISKKNDTINKPEKANRKVVIAVLSDLRVAGLASGMDTESIIKDLMRAHRMPVDRLQQNRQILEWQQEAYREINTSLRSFRDKVFNMRLQSTYLVKNAVSSMDGVLTATAGSNAVAGSYTVTVRQLAEGVSKGSQSPLPSASGENGTLKLAEQFNLSDTITFTLEGKNGAKDFSFDTETATIYDVVAEINKAGLGIKASYDSALNRFFLTTESTGADQLIKVTSDSHSFMSFNLSARETVEDSVLKLNIQLFNHDAGAGAYQGQDAVIDFGDAENLSSSTNNITVNGIAMNLKAAGTVSINVTGNVDAVFNSIKDFVDQYNSMVENITGKLYEKKYSDYLPLTDEQREQLTDDQIKKWEEKARSGLLRNDALLSGLAGRMRQTMSGVVPGLDGGYNTLADLGIKTTADYMSAKLEIDETKLREALQKDPDAVMNLFTRSSDNYEEKGIAQRLYDDVTHGMNQIIDRAGSYNEFSQVDNSFIGKRLKDIDTRINNWEDRLAKIEDRYWRQFTAMEKAIQQMNTQSMWLMQQFGTYGQ